jgi:hypothetical protein
MILRALRVRAQRVSTSDEFFLEHRVSSSDHDNCKFTSYHLNPTFPAIPSSNISPKGVLPHRYKPQNLTFEDAKH